MKTIQLKGDGKMGEKNFQFIVFFSTLTTCSNIFAATATFSWMPNTETNLAGYTIYYGYNSRDYQFQSNVGNPPATAGRICHTVTGLESNTLYYFTVIAYDDSGRESDYAWELAYLTPPADPSTKFPSWTVYLDDNQIQDVLFIGEDGVYAIYGSNDTTHEPIRITTSFGSNNGWDPNKNIITILDIDNDGWNDIIGFGDYGLRVAYGIDGRNFEDSTVIISGTFSYSNNWVIERNPRGFIDINGDGILDVYGFGDYGLRVAYGIDGRNFEDSTVIIQGDFTYSTGWHVEHSRDFIDVNNDGFVDIDGWKDGVHWVSLSVNGEYFEDAIQWH